MTITRGKTSSGYFFLINTISPTVKNKTVTSILKLAFNLKKEYTQKNKSKAQKIAFTATDSGLIQGYFSSVSISALAPSRQPIGRRLKINSTRFTEKTVLKQQQEKIHRQKFTSTPANVIKSSFANGRYDTSRVIFIPPP